MLKLTPAETEAPTEASRPWVASLVRLATGRGGGGARESGVLRGSGEPARRSKEPGAGRAWLSAMILFLASGALSAALTWLLARALPGPPVEGATLGALVFVPLWTVAMLIGFSSGALTQPKVRKGHARRQLFALHRRLGGVLAIAAMLVFGTGVGAILDRSLEAWQLGAGAGAGAPASAGQPEGERGLDAAFEGLLREYPELHDGQLALHPASASHPWIQADFETAQGERLHLDLDPQTGVEVARGRGPLWVLRDLHRRLLAPPLLGEPILGLLGLGLAVVLLTGLATRRWLLRRPSSEARRTPRPLAMRAHQWIGAGLLAPALLWAWSGAMLGLTLVVLPLVGDAAYEGDRAALVRDALGRERLPLELATPPGSHPMPALSQIASRRCPAVARAFPEGAEVHRILVAHPGQDSATVHVDFEAPGLLGRGSMIVDAEGELRDCRALPDAGPGLAGFWAAIALHFGEWAPRWAPHAVVDLLYVVLGSGCFALSWLGALLLARRRERQGARAAAVRMRRWASATGLGLILVTLGLALLSRFPSLARNEDLALVTAAGITVAVGLWTFTGDLPRRARALLAVISVGLGALPLLTAWPRGAPLGLFEVLCWFTALCIGAVWLRPRSLQSPP